ncbi:Immunity protein 17, partial [Dysosmobacter welbionis]
GGPPPSAGGGDFRPAPRGDAPHYPGTGDAVLSGRAAVYHRAGAGVCSAHRCGVPYVGGHESGQYRPVPLGGAAGYTPLPGG